MFVLCIESSHARGMGHLYRGLTLADELMRQGCTVRFLINDHASSLRVLRDRGYLPEIVDLSVGAVGWEVEVVRRLRPSVWVNDRLDTAADHVGRVKALGVPVATFDDRGSGAALSDLNVAALLFDTQDIARLQGRVVLSGVSYLVINPGIAAYRRQRTHMGSLLVTLGGSDTYGATVKVVRLLRAWTTPVTVVLGPAFDHHRELAAALPQGFVVKQGVPSMVEEMAAHDLAITGGGLTPFEANAGGLPCIVVANEHFEVPVGKELQRLGGCRFAGHHAAIEESVFRTNLPIADMSRRAMESIGLDGVQRVASAIMGLSRQ